MTDTVELKPCFCGGIDIKILHHGLPGIKPGVMCMDCKASAISIDAWNTRTAPVVKPLPWRDSYGVMRADTEIGTYYLRGSYVDLRMQDRSLMAGNSTPELVAQADYEKRTLSTLELTAPDADAIRNKALELSVEWMPRGIGSNWEIPDLKTGIVYDGCHPDLSGFVKTKADAHLACAIFNGNAHLDFRPAEPNWIQVKVSCNVLTLAYLEEAVRDNDCILTSSIVTRALKTGEDG